MSQEPENHETTGEQTLEEMRADLERAGYLDLIEEIVRNHPGLTEEEAVEHLHSFY